MKKTSYVLLILSFVLAACAPTAVPPLVIIVTATGGQAAAPAATAVPSDTPVAAAAAPTDTAAPGGPTVTPVPAQEATATPPPAIGASVFANFVQTGDHFSLKCAPGQITLAATSLDLKHIVAAYVSYRLTDKNTGASTGWGAPVKMSGDALGNYTINFTALDIKPDFRLKNAWFDYQFIGLNSSSNVVGRSPIFSQKVTFTSACP